MTMPKVVSRDEWLTARKALLVKVACPGCSFQADHVDGPGTPKGRCEGDCPTWLRRHDEYEDEQRSVGAA